MTDRELLELAAKAAGIPGYWAEDINEYITPRNKYQTKRRGDYDIWSPPTDDGDALRLAVTLKLAISVWFDNTTVESDDAGTVKEAHNGDPYAATRRAIVRAAAKIGKELK